MGKIRWDAANDQIILEIHDISVDANAIAAAWRKYSTTYLDTTSLPLTSIPAGEEACKPTPRAIKERITKIRDLVRRAKTADTDDAKTGAPKKARSRKSTMDGAVEPKTPARKRKRANLASPNEGLIKTEPTAEEFDKLFADNARELSEEALARLDGLDVQQVKHLKSSFLSARGGESDEDFEIEEASPFEALH
ncbi:hypothetical protein NUU61_001054 [Penicillium alfredii]|uniref:Uncharacterized protein n=1 Tax=Penicillium alfredii TaxID=1506179 RepID=A0A9W9GC41_9EURO|nr:uncharacterized protein NUU61_001054 [Penicillium alfredii]KAJ5115295.1 hypothetical protein NUU61_001054 [Penicillium alfredii]